MDAAREVPKLLDRRPDLALELEDRSSGGRIRLLGLEQPQPHADPEQALLDAVVEVALELAPFDIAGVPRSGP